MTPCAVPAAMRGHAFGAFSRSSLDGLRLVLFLPLPLGNIPPVLAVLPLAAGILERDGAAVIAGAVLGVLSLAFVGVVTVAVLKTLIAVAVPALAG